MMHYYSFAPLINIPLFIECSCVLLACVVLSIPFLFFMFLLTLLVLCFGYVVLNCYYGCACLNSTYAAYMD